MSVDTQANGKAAYGKACEACHGPEGNGKSQGPALVPLTLELQELITIVRQGIGVMPGTARDRVSDEEISAIRDYLISLAKRKGA
jgi:mono/diheme cytochrome c family protein